MTAQDLTLPVNIISAAVVSIFIVVVDDPKYKEGKTIDLGNKQLGRIASVTRQDDEAHLIIEPWDGSHDPQQLPNILSVIYTQG